MRHRHILLQRWSRRACCVCLAAALVVLLSLTGVARADWDAAWAAFTAGDCVTACEQARAVIAQHDDYAPAYHLIGSCELRLGHTAAALDALQRATSLDKAHQSYRVTLAQGLLAVDNPAEAFSLLQGVDLNACAKEQGEAVWLLFAEAGLRAGHAGAVVNALDQRVKEGTASPSLEQALGHAYKEQGDRLRAIRLLTSAWERDHTLAKSARTAVRLGLELAADNAFIGQRDAVAHQAARLAERLAEHEPSSQNLCLAGETCYRAQEYARAARWLERAAGGELDDPWALYLLGRCRRALGKVDEATAALDAAVQLGPPDELGKRIHAQLAQLCACRLELEESANHYRRAGDEQQAAAMIEIASQSKDAVSQLAEVRARRDRLEEIKQDLLAIDEPQGLDALKVQIAAAEQQEQSIEENLALVRQALCRSN